MTAMDSTSQTSSDEDDFVNEFERCNCTTLSDTTLGVSSGCCAKDIVDKLMVQLKEKDEQLAKNKKAIEEFHNKIREREWKLLITEPIQKKCQEINAALQLSLWKNICKSKLLGSGTSAASVMFCADLDCKSKFVLIFHPQQEKKHPGIVVDIYSLANGCFLSVANDDNEKNRLVVLANSPTAPLDKFLVIVEGVE